jgi:hypothetical protein
MRLKNSVRASALLLTVVMALILAILCSAVILLAFYNRQYEISATVEQRLNRNIISTTNLVLSDSTFISSIQTDTLDLFGNNTDSVAISKEPWGIFQVACLTAFAGRFSKQQSFLYGGSLPVYMEGCVYLADHKRPLYLVGQTRLTGDAYLSKSALKPSFIDQRGYAYDHLLTGTVKISKEELPPLNEACINYLDDIPAKLAGHCLVDSSFRFSPADSLTRSFYDTALVIASHDPVFLENNYLQGHLIIQSDSMVTVNAAAHLEQVIIIAPVVKFQEGFTGSLQVIATDSIIVEPHCTFNYPSSLVLLKHKSFPTQNLIKIGSGSSFHGIIITNCEKEDIVRSFVQLQKDARISGLLYIKGYLSLEGNIIAGTVLTDYFIYRKGASVYENHMVDVEIDRKKLSPHFTGSAIFEGSSDKKIIQWLK